TRVGGPLEYVTRELEHVVGGTALFGFGSELRGDDAWLRVPVLAIAGAPRAVSSSAGDLGPEVVRNFVIARLARQFKSPRRTNDLGNRRVDMKTLERIST